MKPKLDYSSRRWPKAPEAVELFGKKFGRWTVISGSLGKLLCKCDCGNLGTHCHQRLYSGDSKSCGCYRDELAAAAHTTHGMHGHPIWRAWYHAKDRCLRKTDKRFPYYGGRGIRFCERWMKFENFAEDMLPSWVEGLTLERIDVNGNYEPGNCAWATHTEQMNNTTRNRWIEFNGKTQTAEQWSRETGIASCTIRARLKRGWSEEQALTLERQPAFANICRSKP